ncbi:hypothetical protein [Carboxylicivirga sp. N1Y90]|uniref:hypothetical protein n=1 Tax=Carboxylicivirga fragile TaxID=3417571 RepID=UPI003D32C7A0|nr:hypothetical protein [Marinilabiliaceae bacterium N1Y90]
MKSFTLNLLVFASIFTLTNCEKNEESPQSQILYQEFEIDVSNFNNEILTYDINGDKVDDIQLTKEFDMNELDLECLISITPSTDNIKLAYIKTSPEIDFIYFNDIIDKSDIFEWQNQMETKWILKNYTDGDEFYSSEVYFGLKIEQNKQIYYGWFQLSHCVIKNMGFCLIPDKSIKAGQKK